MKYKLFVFLILWQFAHSQEKDILDLNIRSFYFKKNDSLMNFDQLDFKIKFPITTDKKNTFVGSVNYKNIQFSNISSFIPSNLLHGISLQFFWQTKLTENKKITFFTQFGLFSDMIDINNKDFRYATGVRVKTNHNDKLSLGYGLGYTKQFFGNQIVPFIDVEYKPNEKWSLTGQFPIKPKLLYHFNKKVSAGIELSGDATSFRLSESDHNNNFIQINQWLAASKFEIALTKKWQINFAVGYILKQSIKLYNDDSRSPWTIITFPIGKKIEPISKIESSNGMNFQLGISFNPFK